jgi:hypothetical protein
VHIVVQIYCYNNCGIILHEFKPHLPLMYYELESLGHMSPNYVHLYPHHASLTIKQVAFFRNSPRLQIRKHKL